MTAITKAQLKRIAHELHRPVTTLYALSASNDPFITADSPNRRAAAEWFARRAWRALRIEPGAHIRRVFYRVISQDWPLAMPNGQPFLNTDDCWNWLCNAARDARYLGLVSAADFVDRRNAEPLIFLTDESPTPASLDASGEISNLDEEPDFVLPALTITKPTITQRYHVEVWCEKSTINDILEPLGRRFGINLVTGAGELSYTRCIELIERAKQSRRPVRILYVSDFDPAGASMPVAVARKIEFRLHADAEDLDIQVRPVALTHDQCIEYQLPRTPIKDSEHRAATFEARFGEGATELDALEALHPGELERILTAEIERYYDDELNDAIEATADELQGDLDTINARVHREHAETIAALEAARDRVNAAIETFKEEAQPLLDEIERALEAEAPHVNEIAWPEPAEGDEDDDPLFDSTRDYITQIDRYKEH
jgi:hypothetical protein